MNGKCISIIFDFRPYYEFCCIVEWGFCFIKLLANRQQGIKSTFDFKLFPACNVQIGNFILTDHVARHCWSLCLLCCLMWNEW